VCLPTEMGAAPQTSVKINSRGEWETLVDLGYGSWWLLARKQESHTELEFLSLIQGRLLFLITHSTIWKDGWPRRLCHLDVDGFITPKAFLFDPTSEDCETRGYNPSSSSLMDYLPCELILYKKEFGQNSMRAWLSEVKWRIDNKLLLALGTCKIFSTSDPYAGYVKLYDRCY
jgi:hypothetical protein